MSVGIRSSFVTGRDAVLRFMSVLGAVIGYGCLFVFLYVVFWQTYRWFRDGEWTHVGLDDGLRIGLTHCCVNDGGTGRAAELLAWLDSPETWLGMHKVVELVPASLALFAVSIVGNCIFIYCKDRLRKP